ncbi:MAG: PorT family protein [Spirochaetes bacterium]|nr:PorT family protein [Spirochaetota bacterium]
MKKILIIMMCLLLPASVFAIDVTKGVAFGFNNMWNTGSHWDAQLENNTPGEPDYESRFAAGFEVGFFWEIAINDFVSIQPEINFLMLRNRVNFEHEGEEYNWIGTNVFLELPVLVKGNLAVGPGRASIYLGPSFMINLTGGNFAKYSQTGFPDYYEGGDVVTIAGVVGVGYSIPAGPGAFNFGLRYRRALTSSGWWNAGDEPPGLTNTDPVRDNTRANILSLRIGYGFSL